MKRPTLFICHRCEGDEPEVSGEALFAAVKAERKRRGLKPVFALESVKCLGVCDAPCTLQLEGKKRSTYTRTHLSTDDVDAIVTAACAYAALEPGEELPERQLPGTSAD